MKKMAFGLIVGNRNFFPDSLVAEGREKILKILESLGYEAVVLTPSDTKLGAVETWNDAKKCAKLFKENAEKIDGIIVTLPNFGDEKAVANTLRMSGLNVPILIHAFPDDPLKLDISQRRDAFCGKISVCNNLKQFGFNFTLTKKHVLDPDSKEFETEIERFAGICRVVKGLKGLKIGAVGARPSAFNTVRFSEKILERYDISVETIDLSEVLASMEKLSSDDPEVLNELDMLRKSYRIRIVPPEAVTKMAKLSVVLKRWTRENDINATAIQCWTSLEDNLGITPCAIMGMMSEHLKPSACEVDVIGALSMYVLTLASQKPSAIVDWNNNISDEEVLLFHCGNFPPSIYTDVEIRYADVIGTVTGAERAYGACAGTIKPGPMTFFRITSDDFNGKLKAYVGEGEIVEKDVKTFGSRGVARIPQLQNLMQIICKEGFEHHVAVNLSKVADIVKEAMEVYLGISTYYHSPKMQKLSPL